MARVSEQTGRIPLYPASVAGGSGTRPRGYVLGFVVLAAVSLAVVGGHARADGSASDGTRSLSVSQSDGLAAEGQSITVSGSGYDQSKGIYVALCVVPPRGSLPSPCGGGIDREGDGGASVWISDNAPTYASGLARAYGPGGTFTVAIRVGPMINAVTDCRVVRCAIVTKSDHTINDDRSQDLLIPVTFLGQPAAPVTTVGKAAPTTTAADGATATTLVNGDQPTSNDGSSDSTVSDGTNTDASSEDGVTEVTVADGVDDLAEVARSADGRRIPSPVLLAIALLVIGVAVVAWFTTRRRS